MDSESNILQPHAVQPSAAHSHTVILLHGRDSTATEFAAKFFESQASDDRTLPEIPPPPGRFPRRNAACQLCRFGGEMSQWFDMWDVADPSQRAEIQKEGLGESASHIAEVIAKESLFVSTEKIILGGISQGCATAVVCLLRGKHKLGAFIGFQTTTDCGVCCPLRGRRGGAYREWTEAMREAGGPWIGC